MIEETKEEKVTDNNDPVGVKPPDQVHVFLKKILIIFLDNFQSTNENEEQLRLIRMCLENATDEHAVKKIASELAVLSSDSFSSSELDISSSENFNSLPEVNDIFIQLIESLTVPKELQPQAILLKQKLSNNHDGSEMQFNVAQSLKMVVNFISDMRSLLSEEKEELEQFLRELTDRLGEIDESLSSVQTHNNKSLNTSQELSDTVDGQVNSIEKTVIKATDLEQLKFNIKTKVSVLRKQIGRYKSNEEQRQSEMEHELSNLKNRLFSVEEETRSLRTRLRQKHKQALIDPLTGVNNRLAYEEKIKYEFARWKRYKTLLSLLIVDADHFKDVNDNFGHNAGDKALKYIAQQLQKNLRETDFLTRYGGEEFVVLIPETPYDHVFHVAEKLRISIEKSNFQYNSTKINITISCGIAHFRDADLPEDVFNRADIALYSAKDGGRNKCCINEK